MKKAESFKAEAENVLKEYKNAMASANERAKSLLDNTQLEMLPEKAGKKPKICLQNRKNRRPANFNCEKRRFCPCTAEEAIV